MKFMVNGAVTLGTLDGANIEIVEEAGKENAFIFGLTKDEIITIENEHSYNPQKYLERNPQLAKIMNQLIDGTFDPDTQLFRELYDSLVYGVEGQRPDVYYVLADFDSYVKAQEQVAKAYTDRKRWAKMALLNIARSGKFSSDRTIEDYVRDISEDKTGKKPSFHIAFIAGNPDAPWRRRIPAHTGRKQQRLLSGQHLDMG